MEKNVKFIKAAYSKTMIQIDVDGTVKWCNADKKAYNWTKHKEKEGTYKEGDIVTIEYEEKGQIWYVNKIWQGQKPVDDGSQQEPVQTVAVTQPVATVPVCSKCGASTTYMSGTSKKNGKPYAGNKCTNGACKNIDWVDAGSPPPASAVVQQQVPVTKTYAETSSKSYIADKPEIVAENINTAVAQTLIALQGHVNLTNVEELVKRLQVVYVDSCIENINKLRGGV